MVSSKVANNTEVHIRLIQFEPSWALHCLLRFKNFPYLCENAATNSCLGSRLPLIIDGNYFFTERLALEHLSIRNTGDLSNKCAITNDDHISDKMMCNHIEVSLLEVYKKLELLIEERNKKAFSDTRIVALSIPTKIISKFKNYVKIFDFMSEGVKDNNYDGSDIAALLARLDTIYTQLDTILQNNTGHLIKLENKEENLRSVSDSMLFGHLTKALSHTSVSILLKKHTSLSKFFDDIMNIYFLIPAEFSDQSLQHLLWKDALYSISENHVFRLASDEILKKKIMAALDGPLNESPSNFSIQNPLKSQLEQNSIKINNDQIGESYVKSYQLNGPRTILNQCSRWSGYYFSLPSTFKKLFPLLPINFKIKTVPGNRRLEVYEIRKITEDDVEISLFSVVFITAISGAILHNVFKTD